jgi:hypothetical protein
MQSWHELWCVGNKDCPNYTCLRLSILLQVQTSKELILDYHLFFYHQRKAHRLDTIIEHHTRIQAHMHSIQFKLEQYASQAKDLEAKLHIATSTQIWKHTNQSYGAKETTTGWFTLKRKLQASFISMIIQNMYDKKKTIGSVCFNYV